MTLSEEFHGTAVLSAPYAPGVQPGVAVDPAPSASAPSASVPAAPVSVAQATAAPAFVRATAAPAFVRAAAPERSTLDELRLLVAAPRSRRTGLRDEFIGSHRKTFRLIAHRLCRVLGLAYATHREDIEQLVALEAVAFVDEILAAPESLEELGNWEGMLHVRARATVRDWADRHLSPASGMISLSRRVRRLNALRDEMRTASGSEPTTGEVEAEHNRRMAAARKDAAKQGMLVTVGEMDLFRPAVDVQALELGIGSDDAGMLHPTEGPRLVRAVIQRAQAIGGVTAEVAACWLSGVYSSEGDQRVLTPREVAEQLDLPQRSAAAQIRKVRAIAKRVLAENLGIHHA